MWNIPIFLLFSWSKFDGVGAVRMKMGMIFLECSSERAKSEGVFDQATGGP